MSLLKGTKTLNNLILQKKSFLKLLSLKLKITSPCTHICSLIWLHTKWFWNIHPFYCYYQILLSWHNNDLYSQELVLSFLQKLSKDKMWLILFSCHLTSNLIIQTKTQSKLIWLSSLSSSAIGILCHLRCSIMAKFATLSTLLCFFLTVVLPPFTNKLTFHLMKTNVKKEVKMMNQTQSSKS